MAWCHALDSRATKTSKSSRNRPMKRSTATACLLAAILGIAGLFLDVLKEPWFGKGAGNHRNEDTPAVLVSAPRISDVPVYIEAVGTIIALKTVIVRPQVDGRLVEVVFKEGQDVKTGDVLARIDPTLYQAQLEQAIAKKAQDAAQLTNARIDLERYEKLASDRSTSRQQADTQRALVAQLLAQTQSDQAAIDNARAVLSYTTIASPIDGRTGIRLVDAGNIVHANDVSGLVLVNQIHPIAASFSIPQQQLAAVSTALAKGTPRVDILAANNQESIESGTLNVIDNQVDQTTGTVRLKANFNNEAEHLWPGQYVSVRIETDTLQGVTTLPSEAIQHGPNGAFVFTVGEDAIVAIRPIAVRYEAEDISVVEGIDLKERVVTTGFSRLAQGARVRIVEANSSEPQADAAGSGKADPGKNNSHKYHRQSQ
jgi:multidrug efflux system membrane fusion protein